MVKRIKRIKKQCGTKQEKKKNYEGTSATIGVFFQNCRVSHPPIKIFFRNFDNKVDIKAIRSIVSLLC